MYKKMNLRKLVEISCIDYQFELLNTLKRQIAVLESIYSEPNINCTPYTPKAHVILFGLNINTF